MLLSLIAVTQFPLEWEGKRSTCAQYGLCILCRLLCPGYFLQWGILPAYHTTVDRLFYHKDAIVGFVLLSILLLFSLDYLATAFVYHKAIIFSNKMIPPGWLSFFFSFWCCFVCRYLDFFQVSLLGIIFLMEISILKITLEMYSFFYLNLFFPRDIMLFRNGDIEDCLLF